MGEKWISKFSLNTVFSWCNSCEPLTYQWLHPCRIDAKKHLIHHPQLEQKCPEHFERLKRYAQQCHWVLSADKRLHNTNTYTHNRRKWLPAVLLAFSIEATADNSNFETTLKAMALPSNKLFEPTSDFSLPESNLKPLKYNAHWHHKIESILKAHWRQTPSDPNTISQDLTNMAIYFSQFPKVQALLASLEPHKWQLQYAYKTYETQIRGSRFHVDDVTVNFDPRSAAKFKFYKECSNKTAFCVASPADVLLHELIHVKTVVTTPSTFIAQGGMDSLMYPYEHEQQTILEERQIYLSMTAVDGHPRPLRNEHSGRHVLAACVTCLQ